jgi:hypothetical protein
VEDIVSQRTDNLLRLAIGIGLLFLVGLGVLGGSLLREFQRNDPSSESPTVPTSPQEVARPGWRQDLAPPNPRLAYADGLGDGLYLTSMEKRPERIAELVDEQRARQDALVDLAWSADGRYLGWLQVPSGLEVEEEAKNNPGSVNGTVTVLDTTTGTRRSWKAPPSHSTKLAFTGQLLAAWDYGELRLYDIRQPIVRQVAIPEGHLDGSVLAGTPEGVLVRQPAEPMTEPGRDVRIWLVRHDGSVRDYWSMTGPDSVSRLAVHPPTSTIAIVTSRRVASCWVDGIGLTNPSSTSIREIQLPSPPPGQVWKVTQLEYGADGTLNVLLTHDKPCGETLRGSRLFRLVGDRLEPHPLVVNAEWRLGAVAGPGGRVAGQRDRMNKARERESQIVVVEPPGRRWTIPMERPQTYEFLIRWAPS